jgi:hypothetical protein
MPQMDLPTATVQDALQVTRMSMNKNKKWRRNVHDITKLNKFDDFDFIELTQLGQEHQDRLRMQHAMRK